MVISREFFQRKFLHIAKSVIFENNRLTIEEQYRAIQNLYTKMLTEFCLMAFIASGQFN